MTKKNRTVHYYARTKNALHRFNNPTLRDEWVHESPDTRAIVICKELSRAELASDKVYEPFLVRKEIQVWQRLETHEVYAGTKAEEEMNMDEIRHEIRKAVQEAMGEQPDEPGLDVDLTLLANELMLQSDYVRKIGKKSGDEMAGIALAMIADKMVAIHEKMMHMASGK